MLGPYLVNFARVMGLEDAVASHLHLHRRERRDGFTAMQMLWVLAEAILYGIDRVDNISVLGTDALPPFLHGLDRIPTAQAARLSVDRQAISSSASRRRSQKGNRR